MLARHGFQKRALENARKSFRIIARNVSKKVQKRFQKRFRKDLGQLPENIHWSFRKSFRSNVRKKTEQMRGLAGPQLPDSSSWLLRLGSIKKINSPFTYELIFLSAWPRRIVNFYIHSLEIFFLELLALQKPVMLNIKSSCWIFLAGWWLRALVQILPGGAPGGREGGLT